MNENEPLELYCPECGYKAYLNEAMSEIQPREQRMKFLQSFQEGQNPVWLCIRCMSDKNKSVPLEIH